MKHLRLFEEYNEPCITLYHGTTKQNAVRLITNGWEVSNIIGSNLGNPKYLYLTSEPEDAMWFANENSGDVILQVIDIPISYLIPDPEDEAGFSMRELLDRFYSTKKYKTPVKFALYKPLDSKHFNYYEAS